MEGVYPTSHQAAPLLPPRCGCRGHTHIHTHTPGGRGFHGEGTAPGLRGVSVPAGWAGMRWGEGGAGS